MRMPRSFGFAVLAILGSFGAILAAHPAAAAQIFVCQPSATQPCTSPPGGTAIGGESNLITTPGVFDIGVAGQLYLKNPPVGGVAAGKGGGAGRPRLSRPSHLTRSLDATAVLAARR